MTAAAVEETAPAGTSGGESPSPVEIVEGRLLAVDEVRYHAHPALSSSTARKLLAPSTPARARWEQENRKDTAYFDEGHAVHAELLGVGARVVEVKHDNWRTNAAKAAAADARSRGHVPLLTKQHDQVLAMVEAVMTHPLAAKLLEPGTFVPERNTWWTDERTGVQCRAMFDALRGLDGTGPLCIVDVKTTTSVAMHDLRKTVAKFGYHQQDSWYRTGLEQLLGERPAFVFIIVEKDPPYFTRVVQLDDEALAVAEDRNRRALDVWAECTSTGVWPGHPNEIEELSLPGWALA